MTAVGPCEAHNQYLFPKFTLQPKQKVTLHSGSGKNTEQELFWGSRTPIWNDNGDSIFSFEMPKGSLF